MTIRPAPTHLSYGVDINNDLRRAVMRRGLTWVMPNHAHDPFASRHPTQPRAEAGDAHVSSVHWSLPQYSGSLSLCFAYWHEEEACDGKTSLTLYDRAWARLYLPNEIGPVLTASPVWEHAAPTDEVVELYRRWLLGG